MRPSRFSPASILPILASLSLTATVFADGLIYIPRPPPPPPRPIRPWVPPPRPNFPLEVTRHVVAVEIDETVARTKVVETFHNPNDAQLEGVYLFPLPPDAAVSGFAMKIGGKEVSGEVLEKDKARRIYESIVREARDPGLLEYVDRGLFRASVFPIPPRGDVEVTIEYSEALRRERGIASYRYPLDTGKYSSGDYKNVVIDLRLRSAAPIRGIHCPSHDAALVTRGGDGEARVSLEAKTLRADKDLVVTWNVLEDALAPALVAYRGAEAEGFFLLTISPRPDGPQAIPSKDVVFAIDTSGSMSDRKIAQVQTALRHAVAGLRAGDRFNVISFATEASRFRDGLVDATDESREAARVYIDALRARGGTNIEEAIRFGLADLQGGDRLGMLVLLTDGEPTIGVVSPAEILKTVKEKNPSRRRIFVFGVGTDLNAKLLDAVAREGRGATQYIRGEEDLEVPISTFFDKIDSPVLTDLEIAFPSGDVDDIYPRPLPDVFRGEGLEVFGRYRADGSKTVVLKGRLMGEPRVFEHALPFQPRDSGSYVPRLWAMRKIGYLLEQMRLSGESAEVRDEVVRLSKRYGVITPYTSYLILEEERLAMRGPPAPSGAAATDRPELPDLAFRRAARDAIVAGAPGEAAKPEEERFRYAADAFEAGGGERGVAASRALGALKGGTGAGVVREFLDEGLDRGAERVKQVEDRTFYLQGTRWVDAALGVGKAGGKPAEASRKGPDGKEPDGKEPTGPPQETRVRYLSDEYFRLLADEPGIGKLLAVGEEVTFLWKGRTIVVEA